MSRIMNRRKIFVGLTALLAGVAGTLPLSAQSEGEGGMSMGSQHAEIGTLEAVGLRDQRIVVEYPHDISEYPGTTTPSYRSFATSPTTLVQGLGKALHVEDITDKQLGRIVVVTFKPDAERPMAETITFPLATQIRATHGTVQSVDHANHRMTLQAADGREETFALDNGFGVEIDSNEGLLDVSDLQKGQEITVYYAGPGAAAAENDLPQSAYLIFKRS